MSGKEWREVSDSVQNQSRETDTSEHIPEEIEEDNTERKNISLGKRIAATVGVGAASLAAGVTYAMPEIKTYDAGYQTQIVQLLDQEKSGDSEFVPAYVETEDQENHLKAFAEKILDGLHEVTEQMKERENNELKLGSDNDDVPDPSDYFELLENEDGSMSLEIDAKGYMLAKSQNEDLGEDDSQDPPNRSEEDENDDVFEDEEDALSPPTADPPNEDLTVDKNDMIFIEEDVEPESSENSSEKEEIEEDTQKNDSM